MKTIKCINCNNEGHSSKECYLPIFSYGILCYYKHNNQIKYLMIQRKHSICFIEFVRGKYNIYNEKYIIKLIQNMSNKERDMLLTTDFDTLWKYLWSNFKPNSNIYGKEYLTSKQQYEKLKNGNILHSYIYSLNDKCVDTEWEFPKGRRWFSETPKECALREFCEETGMNKDNIKIQDTVVFDEIFAGYNNNLYQNVYFIAECINFNSDIIHNNDCVPNGEVSNIEWIPYDDVLLRIHEFHSERKDIFKKMDNFVCAQT